jgi:hypothetical protein
LGRPFYRRPREGDRRSSAGAGDVHSAGINAAQRRRRDLTAGRYRARTRSSGKDGVVQTLLCGEGMGEGTGAMEGTTVGGDRDEPYVGRTTKRLTGGAGLPAGVSARERAAGRWGRLASERERKRGATARAREQAGNGPKGGERGREGGKAVAAWAGFIPARGGFSFSFYFLIPISFFYILFF